MKRTSNIFQNVIVALAFMFIYTMAIGQGTIKTPMNQTVYVEDGYDNIYWLILWENDASNWISENDSDADRKEPATSNYNCHAYAWHVSDGGDDEDCWLAYDISGNSNLAKYWTNDAYSHTSSNGNYKKLFYGISADHSAITTASPGVVRSKWGHWPLYEHEKHDCPYENPTYTYYTVPLNGDDLVCSSKTYTTKNISNATYNWNGSKVSISGTSYSETATKSIDGTGWLYVEISSPNSVTTIKSKKTIWVGAPVISSIDGPQSVPNNYWAYYSAQLESSLSAPTDYNWTLSPLNGNYVYEHGDNGVNVNCDILFSNTGNYQLVVQAKNTCSAPNFGPYCVRGIYVYNSYYMMISPNPTTGEATISIDSNTEELGLKSASTEPVFDETTEWELEVYSPAQALKEKIIKLKGKSTTIQTQNWKEGVYVVRVKYKDEILPVSWWLKNSPVFYGSTSKKKITA